MRKFREENEVFSKKDICPYYSVYIHKCGLVFQAVCGGRHNTKEGYKSCVTYKLQRKEDNEKGIINIKGEIK